MLKSRGKVVDADDIEFENVPIVTPNGDILVRSLTFYVRHGVRCWPLVDYSHAEATWFSNTCSWLDRTGVANLRCSASLEGSGPSMAE